MLRLLRGTLSLREIGQELHLSPNTIKTHAQAIYRKLGVSTRHDAGESEAARLAVLLDAARCSRAQIRWSCRARRTASLR